MCPSEVSDIDSAIFDVYGPQGLVVYGIAPDQDDAQVAAFVDSLDIGMPVLVDPEGTLDALYLMDPAFETAAFPMNWLIGPDGRFVYGDNTFDADELVARVEALLAEG